MILSSLGLDEIRARLGETGLLLRIDPLVVRVQTGIPAVASALRFQYADHVVLDDGNAFSDFLVALERPMGYRSWLKPQVNFVFDGEIPFKPLPLSQAYPVFEWGLNWCIANHYHRFVIVHAAVVARDGLAVVMPGEPGAGKSTLSAVLSNIGWRLLSDEMALFVPLTNRLTPIPRPICLKNDSIDLIRGFAPDVAIGERYHDTRKGDVAHMRAPKQSIRSSNETATARWVIFPRYQAGAELEALPISKAEAVLRLADQCFNYAQLGIEAFQTLCAVADGANCLSLTYSRISDAVAYFDRLPGSTWE